MDRREFSKGMALATVAGLMDVRNVFSDTVAPMSNSNGQASIYPKFSHNTKITIENFYKHHCYI